MRLMRGSVAALATLVLVLLAPERARAQSPTNAPAEAADDGEDEGQDDHEGPGGHGGHGPGFGGGLDRCRPIPQARLNGKKHFELPYFVVDALTEGKSECSDYTHGANIVVGSVGDVVKSYCQTLPTGELRVCVVSRKSVRQLLADHSLSPDKVADLDFKGVDIASLSFRGKCIQCQA